MQYRQILNDTRWNEILYGEIDEVTDKITTVISEAAMMSVSNKLL
ncbi:MAG: hypothetical protein N0E48_22240 [Candidatus Thiodiazotropha endolucinida]|nr:hypothetical protein [Candidatus Thiodiazotropha endolucinida]